MTQKLIDSALNEESFTKKIVGSETKVYEFN